MSEENKEYCMQCGAEVIGFHQCPGVPGEDEPEPDRQDWLEAIFKPPEERPPFDQLGDASPGGSWGVAQSDPVANIRRAMEQIKAEPYRGHPPVIHPGVYEGVRRDAARLGIIDEDEPLTVTAAVEWFSRTAEVEDRKVQSWRAHLVAAFYLS